MKATTIKVSVETRERLRALGGKTYESTIIEALDVMDSNQFWAQADDATAWRKSLTPSDQAELEQRDTAIDAAFDGLE